MKRRMAIIGLVAVVAVGVVATALGGLALAQGRGGQPPAPAVSQPSSSSTGSADSSRVGANKPLQAQRSGASDVGRSGGAQWSSPLQRVADLLGMTIDEILAERRQGRSLTEIAAARGVDQATLVQTMTAGERSHLEQQVARGRLTQERADAILRQVEQRTIQFVSRTDPPPSASSGSRSRGHSW